jgi:hypothetical protein
MNQESKQLPIPSLNADQVKFLINYVNEQLPTKYGKEILKFIEKIAIELDQQKENKDIDSK